jgi:hypothetical protein
MGFQSIQSDDPTALPNPLGRGCGPRSARSLPFQLSTRHFQSATKATADRPRTNGIGSGTTPSAGNTVSFEPLDETHNLGEFPPPLTPPISELRPEGWVTYTGLVVFRVGPRDEGSETGFEPTLGQRVTPFQSGVAPAGLIWAATQKHDSQIAQIQNLFISFPVTAPDISVLQHSLSQMNGPEQKIPQLD